ncbi:hypothetical protein BC831DRAFT_509781 [Entophlyctis helioformis]|nr:hypothetical protein BC831DRAFT_509781 [Entophlyctis helioformis]
MAAQASLRRRPSKPLPPIPLLQIPRSVLPPTPHACPSHPAPVLPTHSSVSIDTSVNIETDALLADTLKPPMPESVQQEEQPVFSGTIISVSASQPTASSSLSLTRWFHSPTRTLRCGAWTRKTAVHLVIGPTWIQEYLARPDGRPGELLHSLPTCSTAFALLQAKPGKLRFLLKNTCDAVEPPRVFEVGTRPELNLWYMQLRRASTITTPRDHEEILAQPLVSQQQQQQQQRLQQKQKQLFVEAGQEDDAASIESPLDDWLRSALAQDAQDANDAHDMQTETDGRGYKRSSDATFASVLNALIDSHNTPDPAEHTATPPEKPVMPLKRPSSLPHLVSAVSAELVQVHAKAMSCIAQTRSRQEKLDALQAKAGQLQSELQSLLLLR